MVKYPISRSVSYTKSVLPDQSWGVPCDTRLCRLQGALFSLERLLGTSAPESHILLGEECSSEPPTHWREKLRGPILLGDHSLELISTEILDLLAPTSKVNAGPWRLSLPIRQKSALTSSPLGPIGLRVSAAL